MRLELRFPSVSSKPNARRTRSRYNSILASPDDDRSPFQVSSVRLGYGRHRVKLGSNYTVNAFYARSASRKRWEIAVLTASGRSAYASRLIITVPSAV